MKILFTLLIFWLILWVNFIARDLYKRGDLAEYKVLLKSDYEGKHARTYGERLYEFLSFAKNNIPSNAHYEFVGIKPRSLDSRRGIYYLYPCLKRGKPDYLLVYDTKGFRKSGFHIYAKLDETRFVLKKD